MGIPYVKVRRLLHSVCVIALGLGLCFIPIHLQRSEYVTSVRIRARSSDQDLLLQYYLPWNDNELIGHLKFYLLIVELSLKKGAKRIPKQLSDLIDACNKDLFTSLNWDRKTGKLRDDDPYDFVDFSAQTMRLLSWIKNNP